ncbi:tetratricopeptide repeat protein [Pseudomonas sp. KSR10]|uniref:tetratricopeptide repeat protein n=1 Tax=Pseudomonas sp. KSR10 TaxID=2916654 RepID=UPI001EF84F22|nr:tetratricopeptide repeat protein [Pseudomonas sp. KSR10]MCG6539760.1 tetratricopeptide repeat protein [Pseudomonas sp. KSR10]
MIAAALMASAECHGIVMPLWPNRLLHPRRSYPLPEFVRPRLSAVFVCMALSACASNPTPPVSDRDRLLSLAEQVRRGGDPASAVALYERAAELSDQAPEVMLALGDTMLVTGDASGAAQAFRAVLTRNPDDPQALLGLGTADLQQGRVERAVRSLQAAAPQIDTAVAYNRLGTAYVLSGAFTEAQAAYGTALAHAGGDLDIRSNLALAFALDGQAQRARAEATAITESPLSEPHHVRQQMLVLTLLGDDQSAADALAGLPKAERGELLAQARAIRSIKDPAARARAVGLLTSTQL